MKSTKIPEATISRLSVYSRFLTQIETTGVGRISSGEIAAAQIRHRSRKNFSLFRRIRHQRRRL